MQAANDIQSLINSTEVGTIILDRAFRVQFFTPRIRDIFKLVPADRGRPLLEVSSTLGDMDLRHQVERVLDTLQRVEREVQTRDHRWFNIQILPYHTSDDRIDGVVMTFLDVTERKRIEHALRLSDERLRSVMEGVAQHAIITLDFHGTIQSWNSGAEQMFGFSADEVVGQSAALIFTPEDRAAGAPETELDIARREGRAIDERWHVRKDGTRLFVSGVLSPIGAPETTGFVKIARDLTERKHWEDRLQRAYSELEIRVEERTQQLAAANASLEQELCERREAEERVRRLLSRLITVQEEERRRIARDLHDHLGQQMSALHLRLEALRQKPADYDEWQRKFKETQEFVLQLDRDLDFFTWELRPAALYDLGLVSALHDYVATWSETFQITAEFHDMSMPPRRLAKELETNLYRIAQEALNNVLKHAQATTVDVRLRVRDNDVVLTVEDDGVGFTPDETAATTAIGLIGMEERAAVVGGRVEIESAPGKGTTVIATVPVVFAPSTQ